jgi:hypothetical protein
MLKKIKKNKKREGSREHRTPANPPQKPTHKAQCGWYAGVQPFPATKKNAVLRLSERK